MSHPEHQRWRPWTRGEELANAVSHGLGLAAAAAVTPMLVLGAWQMGGPLAASAAAVFGGAMVLVYLASTLHHGVPRGRAKDVLEVVDKAAIYVLIAGTYTPFTLGVLRGTWGWMLMAAVWALAAYGVFRTVAGGTERPYQGTRLYLAMGWLVVLVIGPVMERMHPTGLSLIVAGGVAYTVGVAFYVANRMKYHHLIWHLCVIAGSACHVMAALWYAAA
ncbi:PAQR family membrane homeostasis protein TrhA [Tautonia plasticadhaerens]|uniref:Hemolysin-III related n=1 Tax=Tautonia plasticadhaerens TaxID=2527974 RepID=A0A518HA44_9BACT|nr:hemolysin III family protein [Tautonia plasticadhaerens]QDV37722.1 hemolysin-III related [Tautonia plasticadhaerens]